MTANRTSPPRVVAIIPARRGSKRLPLKNLRLLGGVPLFVHSMRAALAASLVTDVVVSTEDEEIAAVATAQGAAVVRRPAALASDTAQNNDVVGHVLASATYDFLALLQPTSPLRRPADIDGCLAPVMAGEAMSAMTVTDVEHHPGKAVLIENGLVTPFTNDTDMEARRQDMRDVYRQNGAVYAIATSTFLQHQRFYVKPCAAVLMPADLSIDIDREIDLILAELLLRHSQAGPR
jgi:CMP-N-acetylneuraminic acid synthetase